MSPQITILPEQARRIAEVTAKTGAAIGVSQHGSTLVLHLNGGHFEIDSKGNEIPQPDQERLC